MTKVLLISPPFCNPTFLPYHLLEIRAYCEARGFKNIIDVFDWNNFCFQALLNPELLTASVFNSLNSFLNFNEYIKVTNKVIRDWFEIAKTKEDALYNYLQDKTDTPSFLQEFVAGINFTNYNCIGFSLTFHQEGELSQFLATFAAAKYLRSSGFKGELILGGALVNQLDMRTVLKRFPFFNGVFFKESEESFFQFLKGNNKDRSNFYSFEQEQVKFENNVIRDLALNPRLEGLDLRKYLSPEPVISVQYKRGCSWGKCSFCGQNTSYFGYEDNKKIALFFHKITTMITSGIKYFYFSDQMLTVKDLRTICLEIETRKLHFFWTFMAMPTKDFSNELLCRLRKCGCVWITWGIESGSKRILKKIKKPINLQHTKEVIVKAHLAGIKNVLLMMYAIPGETKADFQLTLDFIAALQPYFYDNSMSPYYVTYGSYIYLNPEQFQVRIKQALPIYKDENSRLDSPLYLHIAKSESESLKRFYQEHLPEPKVSIPFAEHMLIYSANLDSW